MRILLLTLPRYRSSPAVREERCENISRVFTRLDTPTNLLLIASQLRRQGHSVELLDANALDLHYDDVARTVVRSAPDCAVFPFCSHILDHDLAVCAVVKLARKQCVTIGYSVRSKHYADKILESYEHLDMCVVGHSLSVVPNLVASIDRSQSLERVSGIAYRHDRGVVINKPTATSDAVDLNALPLPAYDLLPSFKPYYLFNRFWKPYALVYSSKGCSFRCAFCKVSRTPYSYASAERVQIGRASCRERV